MCRGRPLSQLPPCLMPSGPRPWPHRPLPQGEPQWEGLELGIQLRRGRRGNPVDDPDGRCRNRGSDEGVVAVNPAANAVAMRADLPTRSRSTWRCPTALRWPPHKPANQAATLLQLPQLGVAALTLVRAGRRQALFYVSDEQLAKQTLAPLLLRDEAATLELKLRYDPPGRVL